MGCKFYGDVGLSAAANGIAGVIKGNQVFDNERKI
jgi:hypothetical protein